MRAGEERRAGRHGEQRHDHGERVSIRAC